MAMLTALLLLVTRPPDFGNIPFRSHMIPTIELRPLYRPAALYVMLDGDPMAYVVPALPRDVRFVRLDGNMPVDPQLGLGRQIADVIITTQAPS